MPDTRISALTALAAADIATTDVLAIVDVGASTTKKVTFADLHNGSFGVNTVATSGATETLTLAPVHKVTMDQACTFTFPTPTLASHTFILHLLGAFTPAFPASVDWSGGAPTYVTPSLYVFTTTDGGTNWLGAFIGGGFA